MHFSNYISEKKSFRNEAFKIRTAAELQAERIRKEAAELAAKVDNDYRSGDYVADAAADDDEDDGADDADDADDANNADDNDNDAKL